MNQFTSQSQRYARGSIPIGMVLALVLLLSTITASSAQAEEGAAPAVPQEAPPVLSPEADEAARIINRLRVENGLHPLTVHPLLTLAAQRHIEDMISSGVYGHSGSDGSNVHQRIARTGYVVDGWAGENWAVYQDVATSIGWWMTDPPHAQNVLNRSYQEMGVGTAPHPRGWGLILVVDFTTGSSNQTAGSVLLPTETTAAVHAPVPQVAVQSDGTHTVQPGDTLWTIAIAYGVNWPDLARINGLTEDSILQIGSKLTIPGAEPVAESAPPAPTYTGPLTTYTVVSGDTVWSVAARHNIGWQELLAINGLAENSVLQIGATLDVPANVPAAPESATAPVRSQPVSDTELPEPRTHTVAEGETLWSIAASYGVDWHALMQVNSLGETDFIAIGQTIQLP